MRPSLPSAVLFDLDGTLVDSAPTITAAIAATLERFGRPVPSPQELRRFVGPPIHVGFRQLAGVPDDELATVVTSYRATYAERMLEAPVFPGVEAVLAALQGAGVPLAVATSKPEPHAERILRARGLTQYFTCVRGASMDESRSAKADIVADALACLRASGADVARAVMVGDRHHDVDGAAAHSLPTVLVRWGYASAGEEAGAHDVVDDAAQLAATLGLEPVRVGSPRQTD